MFGIEEKAKADDNHESICIPAVEPFQEGPSAQFSLTSSPQRLRILTH